MTLSVLLLPSLPRTERAQGKWPLLQLAAAQPRPAPLCSHRV